MKKIVKEFYAAKNDTDLGLSIVMLLDDNDEIRLSLPRDVAIGMIEKLYFALNNGQFKSPIDFQ